MRTIKGLKIGELFRFNESEIAPVWVRGEYIRSECKYSIYKYDDVNHERLISGNRKIFIDFIY